MITSDLIKAIQDAGIAIFLSIVLVGLLLYIVRFTIIKLGKILDKLLDKLEQHEKASAERGRYVRQEHLEMIKTLGRINGYKE